MQNVKIKASQINNLTDARYFAALGVEWIGFKLDLSSDDRVEPALFHGIRSWIEGPKIVAEIGKTPIDLFSEVYELNAFDLLQSSEPIEGRDLIIPFKPNKLEALNSLLPSSIYLLDLEHIPELELYASVSDLQNLNERLNFIWPAPRENNYLKLLLEEIKPYGIEVKGGLEEKVGFKSFDELDVFFDILEESAS